MRLSIAKFYTAHSSNYTKGRTRAVKYFTVHHSAGWEQTLRHLWGTPSRNASSTFWVGNQAGHIEQYVDTADTQWTNGNYIANSESITVEVRGDWRNGYYSASTLKNLENLMVAVLKIHPNIKLNYHQDVSNVYTLCPADLKHKKYALTAWNKAKARLNTKPVPPKPQPSQIKYKKITPKRVVLKGVANLWNFNFTNWSKAQKVKTYGAGHTVDVVAEATNQLGAKYYMTAYSYNNGNVRATNGFNVVDVKDYVQPPKVEPPKVVPKWEPMLTPRKMVAAFDLYVIDLTNDSKVGDIIKKGTEIDFVEKKNTTKVYLRTKWSKDNNKNWGIALDQVEEIKEPVEPEPLPEPPLVVDPDVSQEENINWLVKAVKAILAFFKINV